jgi:hypothetical protein
MRFSLTLPDDQLADMAVAGMLPAIREKLFVLTQNVHSAPITHQAEKLSFARAERK